MTESVPPKLPKSNYVLALEVGGMATAWIVIPAILAAFGGQALDARLQTTPGIFVTSMAIAFTVSIFGIIRMARNYLRQEEKNVNRKT